MKIPHHMIRTTLLASCALFPVALPTAAFAQTAPDDEEQAATPADTGDTITVTGSRIKRDGYDQPTPVTVIATDTLVKSAPTNIADGLNRMPQFLGSRTRTFCCEVSSTGNYLNLRGLGTTRTLILLDGQRVVPTRETGDVDVNLLPEILVQRVDVVTGGASAAYGSDAVSGVVNYVIDNKFTGAKLTLQSGISGYGDDASIKAAGAIGTDFADGRGHMVLSAEHFRQKGIASLADRPQSNRGGFMGGNGSAAAPYTILEGVRQNTVTYGGVIIGSSFLPIADAANPLAGLMFLPDGSTRQFQFGTPIAGSPAFSTGGDGILNNLADPAQDLRTERLYARLSYDVTDSVTAWLRFNGGISQTQGDVLADNRQATVAYTIYRENAFLPDAIGTAMDNAGVTSFRFARFNRDFGPIRLNYKNKTYDVAAGLDGKLGGGWQWAVAVSHGATTLDGRAENDANLARVYAQADAVVDPGSGKIVCRVTLTNPGAFPGCVPINLFGEGAPSQEAKDYVLGVSTQHIRNSQTVVNAELQGDLMPLPGGPLAVAVGAEYRRRSLVEESNEVALNQIQATGIRGFPTALCPTVALCRYGGWQQGNFGTADASDDVKEAFVEVSAPLLKDSAVGSLELNGAYRYTDYKYSGGVSTWKIGAVYSPIPDLRLRVTRSRDIRAPNLFELFAGPVNAFQPGLTDPLTGQTNVIAVTRTQGNAALQPEKADTFTAGAVIAPRFLPGLALAVDYYDIDIGGALSQTTSQGTLDACAQGDTDACSRIQRDGSNVIQQITLLQVNLNSRRVKGIDFDLSYRGGLGGGTVTLRALATRTLTYTDTVGGLTIKQAGFYNTANQLTVPKWRGTLSVNYEAGPFALYVQERIIGGYEQMPPLPTLVYAEPHVDPVFYTDITLTAKVGGENSHFELYGTVNNLFDKKPPFIPNRFAAGLGYPTAPGLYDLDDRYFTVGARVSF